MIDLFLLSVGAGIGAFIYFVGYLLFQNGNGKKNNEEKTEEHEDWPEDDWW